MPYRIILADTSPSIQKLIQSSFPISDFEITTFNEGQEVMNSLHQIKPDAVLLNLSLPQKDGYEVGAFIRGQEGFSQVPIILIKEAFEPLDKEKIGEFEFDELVQKPFDSGKLVKTVRDIIDKRRIPATLPEEPLWEEDVPTEAKVEFDEKIRDLVKEEVLEMERELEKRIKARVMAEIKMWIINSDKNK